MQSWTTRRAEFASFLLMRELDPAGIRQRIRQARKQLGLTQQELADALQVHKRTVENYENTRVPPCDEFNSLAEVLGVSVGWLLHGDAATQAEVGEGEVASSLAALEERQGLVEGALRGQEELLRELLRRLPGEPAEGEAASN